MRRFHKAVSCQCHWLAPIDDGLDNIGGQKGEIDEADNPAWCHACAIGNRLQGLAGFDLFEPGPALSDVFKKRFVNAGRCVAQNQPSLITAAA